MTTIYVNSGTNTQTITDGTEVIVQSGGTGEGNIVIGGGTLLVSSGGITEHAVIDNGGSLVVSSGGTDGGPTTINSGGTVIVSSGGSASTEVVSSGGFLILSSGGATQYSSIGAGGTAIASGGTFGGGNVYSGGLLLVSAGGSADSNNIYGTLIISSGGSDHADYVSSGGTVIFSGGGTDNADHIFNGAVVSVLAGGSSQNDVINSGGTLIVSSGAVDSGDIIGGAVIVSSGGTETAATIATSGTLTIDSGSVVSNGVTFAYTGGVLILSGTAGGLVGDGFAPTQVISAFGSTDTIDLTGINSDDIISHSFPDAGVLEIQTDGSNSENLFLEFNTDVSEDNFTFASDGAGGTDVTICYYPGTGIRTPAGDVAVEQLTIGDEVVTAEGRVLPVRWIGRNTVSTRFADPLRVLPIRIRAGALADNRPERDLLVSPEHAVLVEGILIQAGALVNGLSILREAAVPEIFTYYHVELAEHALLLAEGTPAESFVDNIPRTGFDNWAEHEALYGDAPIAEMPLPRAQSHRQVPPRIREAILARAQSSDPTVETTA